MRFLVEQWKIVVSGRVQGVGFRYGVQRFIERHNMSIVGYVRNLVDGRVEVIAQGAPFDLQQIKEFCAKGPTLAKVDELQVEKLNLDSLQYSKFTIR